MSKAVLISIRPDWVKKIGEGKKTIEVRKTRPNLPTPFKAYIYCSQGNDARRLCGSWAKVIGEFVCDKIDVIQRRGIPENFDYCYLSLNEWGNDDIETEIRDIMGSCIPKERINSYAGKTPVLYAWHISKLEIYDAPKSLSEFRRICDKECNCDGCAKYWANGGDCGINSLQIKRPPQSWRYVEELV